MSYTHLPILGKINRSFASPSALLYTERKDLKGGSFLSLKELFTIEDLEAVYKVSEEKPVILFKQSTTCPISAAAFHALQTLVEQLDEDAYFVKVRETRPVSNQIEADLGVEHQSPQAFIVKNKEAVWNASHQSITVNNMKEALSKASA